MPKVRQKKRRDKKRVIETALPKKQYKRTNRLLYVFSGILLVVFGGGAALVGAGTPRGTPTTPAPIVSTLPPAVVNPSGPADASASPVATPATTGTPQATSPTSASAPAAPTAAPAPPAPTKAP